MCATPHPPHFTLLSFTRCLATAYLSLVQHTHTQQVLGLEDNAISSWGEVLRLAGLPQLQRLALSGNPISSITYPCSPVSTAALFSSSTPPGCAEEPPPEQQQQAQQQQQQQHDASVPAAAGEEPSLQPAVNSSNPVGQLQQQSQQQPQSQAPAFASLKALLLGDCRLSSWSDVDELNKLPGLCELRLSGNPLFTAAPADAAEGSCGGTAAAGAGRRFEVGGRVDHEEGRQGGRESGQTQRHSRHKLWQDVKIWRAVRDVHPWQFAALRWWRQHSTWHFATSCYMHVMSWCYAVM